MKYKIGHMSDIHAGYSQKTVDILKNFLESNREALSTLNVLIVAGDIASTSLHQIDTAFRLIREVMPYTPILCVFGNHDYWSKPRSRKFMGYYEIVRRQDDILFDHQVHHLGRRGPVTMGDDVKIWGYDGWYEDIGVTAHNRNFMAPRWQTDPSDPFAFMKDKAIKDFDAIMGDSEFDGTKIMVTHMPPLVLDKDVLSEEYKDQLEDKGLDCSLGPISKNFDYCLMGHFHRLYVEKIERCTFRTTGANYNKPALQVIEL
jgi:DNA repair exonuclease SbcCD nuclease subunit